MSADRIRAKVFISCGQQKDTDEVDIAHRIKEGLDVERSHTTQCETQSGRLVEVLI